jgi:hypothetical protein
MTIVSTVCIPTILLVIMIVLTIVSLVWGYMCTKVVEKEASELESLNAHTTQVQSK